jgi:hypothetical protein
VADLVSRIVALGELPARTLVVEPAFERKQAVVTCRERPVAQLMEALELATGAEWRRAGSAWVLTAAPGVEQLVLLSEAELKGRLESAMKPLKALTPRQMEVLEAGGALGVQDLTVEQRQALLLAAQCCYLLWKGDIAPEGAHLQGAFLRIQKIGKDAVWDPDTGERRDTYVSELGIYLPQTDGFESSASLIWTSEPRLEPRPPRMPKLVPTFPVRPARMPPPYARPARDQDRYQEDSRLAIPVRLGGTTVFEAARAAGSAANLDLLLSTTFGRRAVHLSSGAPSARQIMEAVEQATGGTWRLAGDTYVLQTNVTLERMAQWGPWWYEYVLRESLRDVRGQMSDRQRGMLERSERILPRQLRESQRQALKWAAHVAFAAFPDIDRKALDLDGVELVYARQETPAGVVRQVRYMLPAVTGGTKEVAALPLP